MVDGAESGAAARPRLGGRFWRIWTAGVVNNLGDGALVVGVGLLATTFTHDARVVAAVGAASQLPWLLVTLPAGVLVDRVDRITAMRCSQLAQAAAMSLLTLLAAAHVLNAPLLAALAFLVTTGDVVSGVASQSVLPQIVPEPLLVRANSLTLLGQTISFSFIGQPLGGLLFATASALPLGFETMSYLASAVLLARLRPVRDHRETPPERPGPAGSAAWADAVDGMRWLMRHRLLRTLAVVLGVNTFANQMASSILVLFATGTLGVSRGAYGWMVAASAVGGALGALTSTRLVRRLGGPVALVVALAANSFCYVATGMAANAHVVSGLLALVGFSVAIWNVVSLSMRHALVPASLLGRVTSVNRLIGWGLMPFGALAGGLLAHWLGLRAPFIATGVLRFAVLLVAIPVLLPTLRTRRGTSRGAADA